MFLSMAKMTLESTSKKSFWDIFVKCLTKSKVDFNLYLWINSGNISSGVATGGQGLRQEYHLVFLSQVEVGQSDPHVSKKIAKNREKERKIGKKRKKSGRKGKNREGSFPFPPPDR